MNLVRLGLFLTACAISANGAQAGEGATTSRPRHPTRSETKRGSSILAGCSTGVPWRFCRTMDEKSTLRFSAPPEEKSGSKSVCTEDPFVLQRLKEAIDRGVRVRVIVDHGKYEALPSEQVNLAAYVTGAGAQLHLSNPIFPRSFPKVILIDERYALVGSACLDSTTSPITETMLMSAMSPASSKTCRDCSKTTGDILQVLGQSFPTYPDSSHNSAGSDRVTGERRVSARHLSSRAAQRTLDVTSELLGDPTLESELAEAATKGVRVRLIAPETVNGATQDVQQLQLSSLSALKAAGIHVHVTRPPESAESPYMHARTAVADGIRAYLGSISLSPDSPTYNREVGLILDDTHFVRTLQNQFEMDFKSKSHATDSRTPRLRTRGARRGGVRSRAPPRARRGLRSRRPAPRAGGRCAAPSVACQPSAASAFSHWIVCSMTCAAKRCSRKRTSAS